MASGTLYTFPENFRAFKALIAAKYSNAKVKIVSKQPEFKFGETNKTPEFLAKFPLGKLPAFESNDGICLFESNAIAYYLANAQLRGASDVDRALVLQWMQFADNDMLPAALTWVFPCMGIMAYNKQNTEKAKEDIKTILEALNNHLLTRTYLVGERISLADICVTCNLLLLYQWVLDAEFRKPYVNTNRWFLTMINQPEFVAVVGNVKLCEKMAQFDAKKFAELQGQKSGGGKKQAQEKTPAKEKPKKEEKSAKKKEQTPEANKATEPEEDADEVSQESSKDPFAHLPKGTFNMEEFKRTYSNNDTKTVALPYFWQHFDKENYSVWYAEYKYPEELKMIFMSCNLVTGMFQRLDKMRKHAFGSVIVFGENNNSTISGLWFWRGHELAFNHHDSLQIDYESYTWTKLNPDDAETKKKVEEYLSWEGGFDGKKFNQGKIFK